MGKYINIKEIKQIKDIDGKTPAVVMVETGRGVGKTTGYLLDALEMNYNNKYETLLVFREKTDLECINYMLDDIFAMKQYSKYKGEVEGKWLVKNLVYGLSLNEISILKSVCLKDIDRLKKLSPIFSRVQTIVMDEFETENGYYLKKEAQMLKSLHYTVNRGNGSRDRGVRLFLYGNPVDLFNPHFINRGIHKRWNKDSKIIRGSGWIAVFYTNEEAVKELTNSAVYRAGKDTEVNDRYEDYASGIGSRLIRTESFIEKPKGRSRYICTLLHNGEMYGIRELYQSGIVWVTKSQVEKDCNTVITFQDSQHDSNTLIANHYSYIYKFISNAYRNAWLRFEDGACKMAIFDILAISLYK